MDITLEKIVSGREHSSIMLVIAGESADDLQIAKAFEVFADECALVFTKGAFPKSSEIIQYSEALALRLAEAGLKRLTVVGLGTGGHVAQSLAVNNSKIVRRLILLDTTTKDQQSGMLSYLELIERKLPLGFPLRVRSDEFDSRPFIHRIHCPTLILVSPLTDGYVAEESCHLGRHIPNSWLCKLNTSPINGSEKLSAEFQELLREFLQVATKRPQKGSVVG